MKHARLFAAAAAAALLLSGCGGGASQSANTPASTAPGAAKGTASPAPSGSPASTTPAKAAAEPGPALCTASDLAARTDAGGGGAAGSVYMQLVLSNTGTEPCLLTGFAGVSLAADNGGGPIGAAAKRDETTPAAELLLEPGQAGTAELRYTQARNYMDCAVVQAAGYRIYPPGDTASLFIDQPTDACSNADINLLTIGAFQPAK